MWKESLFLVKKVTNISCSPRNRIGGLGPRGLPYEKKRRLLEEKQFNSSFGVEMIPMMRAM